jgi:hypothetical protein
MLIFNLNSLPSHLTNLDITGPSPNYDSIAILPAGLCKRRFVHFQPRDGNSEDVLFIHLTRHTDDRISPRGTDVPCLIAAKAAVQFDAARVWVEKSDNTGGDVFKPSDEKYYTSASKCLSVFPKDHVTKLLNFDGRYCIRFL